MKLKGPGRLPSPDNLIKKTPDELLKLLGRFGITVDSEAISKRGEQSWLRVKQLVDEGVEPGDEVWAKIAKQNENDMVSNLRKIAKDSIRQFRQDQLAGAKGLVWITRGAGSCPSCEKRHGMIRTMPQWEKIGLPGSSALICEDECNCQLIPAA